MVVKDIAGLLWEVHSPSMLVARVGGYSVALFYTPGGWRMRDSEGTHYMPQLGMRRDELAQQLSKVAYAGLH